MRVLTEKPEVRCVRKWGPKFYTRYKTGVGAGAGAGFSD